jgi:hypothetical protein
MRRALEGGPAAPSKCILVNLQGQIMTVGRRDAIPATVGPVRPPRARGAMPGTVATTPVL